MFEERFYENYYVAWISRCTENTTVLSMNIKGEVQLSPTDNKCGNRMNISRSMEFNRMQPKQRSKRVSSHSGATALGLVSFKRYYEVNIAKSMNTNHQTLSERRSRFKRICSVDRFDERDEENIHEIKSVNGFIEEKTPGNGDSPQSLTSNSLFRILMLSEEDHKYYFSIARTLDG